MQTLIDNLSLGGGRTQSNGSRFNVKLALSAEKRGQHLVPKIFAETFEMVESGFLVSCRELHNVNDIDQDENRDYRNTFLSDSNTCVTIPNSSLPMSESK